MGLPCSSGSALGYSSPLSVNPSAKSSSTHGSVFSSKNEFLIREMGKIGILLSASLYVEIISVLTCTFPSRPLANAAPAHITGWFVCLNDLLFHKWMYIFFWGSSKGALFLIEANVADRAGEVGDIHICRCHTLAEARSLALLSCSVLFCSKLKMQQISVIAGTIQNGTHLLKS